MAIGLKYVRDAVENEGFDYAFRHYSTFDDVKDEEFHKRRTVYVDAARALEDYIEGEDDEDEDK